MDEECFVYTWNIREHEVKKKLPADFLSVVNLTEEDGVF